MAALPLLLAFASLLSTAIKTDTRIKSLLISSEISLKVRGMLESTIRGLDSHPLPLPPIVHSHGIVRMNDGSKAPLGRSFPPDGVSDAISGASLAWKDRMEITQDGSSTTHVVGVACPLEHHPISLTETRSFLGISVEGMVELRGGAERRGSCFNVTLRHVTSILKTDANPYLPGVRIIVPIRWIHTLYVASGGSLRIASHAGGTLLENQPIIGGIEHLGLTSIESSYGVFFLSFNLKPLSGPLTNGISPTHIGRGALLEALLYPGDA